MSSRPSSLPALAALILTCVLCAVAPAHAATLPAGFSEQTMVGGLSMPTAVAWTPDGRMLIAEKEGVLKVADPGQTTARQILDLRSTVHSYWDRGLLGLAVDGQFATNPYVYLLFTYEMAPGNADRYGPMISQLRRYRLNADSTLTDMKVILGTYTSSLCPAPSNAVDCIPSEGDSHSIGSVRSAPDGTLYAGSGDASSYSMVDPLALRTYNEQSLAGKIVHIDREGRGLTGHPFCPAETDLTKVCAKLYNKGFRNPFRFDLLPTGDGLIVGDVGWGEREELDIIRSGGGNYGWPCYEGSGRTSGYADRAECAVEYAREGTATADRVPNWSYDRNGADAAVVGGPMYPSGSYPDDYDGDIFVADYAQGWVKHLDVDAQDRVTAATSFATDWSGVQLIRTPSGDIAYVSFGTGDPGTGSVMRIAYGTGNRVPVADATATPSSGSAPLTVNLSSSASRDPDGDPLTYRWTFGDGTAASTAASPQHVYTAAGTYTVTLTVDDGRGGTASDTVQITAGNDPPVPVIAAPLAGATFRGGDVVALRGSATDPGVGAVAASGLNWRVTLHHGTHTHPIVQVAGAAETSFRAVEDHDADSYYEIELTATDATGLSAVKRVEIRPETRLLKLDSSPAGAPITYAGRAFTAPYSQDAAVGFRTSVSAAERFTRDGRMWEFTGWSDSGARLHDIAIPASALTLTATYRDAGAATGALKPVTASTAFGEVAPGANLTKTVTLRNTGTTPVTITGSTAPGGQFTLDSPLATGTVVAAGADVSRTIRFTPTELGSVQGRWRVTASDGSIVSADLTAAGAIPNVTDTRWQRNGTAAVSTNPAGIELTPALRDRKGTAFWPTPVDARRLDVSFDALITGGTGGDGMALVLADPARGATPTALGLSGGGLGFIGVPGWAAALVTYPNNGVAAPFVGVSDGAATATAVLPRWLKTSAVPVLAGTTPRKVRVQISGGVLKLSVDGVERVSQAVTLPDRVLVGFSAGTGGRTNRHAVSNATIGGAAGPALPPPDGGTGEPGPEPPSLRITNTVVAPPGSAQESTTVRVAGRCPGTFGPLQLAPRASATPTPANAQVGSQCVVEQDAITGDGWSTTATVNNGTPQAISVVDGIIRVPSFALQAGPNTVVLTNRYQPPAPPSQTVPDPSAGGWQLNGVASITGGALQLTPATADSKGSAFWPQTVLANGLSVEFDATVDGGTGADGMTMVLGDPARGATPTSIGGAGGSLGFGGIPGWAVALASYANGTQATGNFVGLSNGAVTGAWQTLGWLQTASLLTPLQNTTRHIKVTVAAGVMTVTVDGAPLLSRAVVLPERVLLGFSAGTGGLTNRHTVRNLKVSSTGTPPPAATLRVRSTIVAPAGTPQASTAVSVSGSCPSAFSATVAAGASATPALTGAVQGTACSVVQAVPSGAGWSATVSVNGGAAQPVTASGGAYTVPAFSLAAGENTVAFTSTYTPTTSTVPDPSAGGWQLNGVASITGGALQLTPATADSKGTAFWPTQIDPAGKTIEFDATVDNGTGADGMTMILGDPTRGALATSLGGGGGSLGFGGIAGWAVALASYPNGTQATGNFVGLSNGAVAGAWQTLGWLQTASLLTPLQNTTRHVKVVIVAGTITVSLDGTPMLSQAVTLPSRVLLGFGAGTGGLTNRHTVRNLVVR
ncbi:MAG: PQQ-dependent sugar dehydrogenase [Solirubrobacteraceae bacterium]|nr:PQQ-dependent sugar dehydrogenase [Solirubrobacteraceae bacterium]